MTWAQLRSSAIGIGANTREPCSVSILKRPAAEGANAVTLGLVVVLHSSHQ